ncbi:hypothetical protein PsorP6_000943 [Peronosclerospora sorghi]|uniref:Uncharacterized protein n=1 Tax=Peronosclerospora sorghi TaxID=230839 RepID=A0ACC0WRZ1_9STRA|nr:hypothetical protein PsorP6_000943 [Peronosclerospora sorghi]
MIRRMASRSACVGGSILTIWSSLPFEITAVSISCERVVVPRTNIRCFDNLTFSKDESITPSIPSSSALCEPAKACREPAIASVPSITKILGDWSTALSNALTKRLSDCPTYVWKMVAAFRKIVGTPKLLQMLLASAVFPTPGRPVIRAPSLGVVTILPSSRGSRRCRIDCNKLLASSIDVCFVTTQYRKYGNHPPYETVSHPAVSIRTGPYTMRVPSVYQVWDIKLEVIGLRRRERQLAVTRCGFVLAGIYFRMNETTALQVPVALKIMDRAQLLLQSDDVESEIRVMNKLQMGGIDSPLANQYMVRWEYASDVYNEYVATEYVANRSLQAYAHRKMHKLMVHHLHEFAHTYGAIPTKVECISYVYRNAGHEWMKEGVELFKGIVRALTYLHAQNVAHPDLDVYNVAVDRQMCPRIIDLGSSQIMDNRGMVGAGNVSIKCKPLFVAPEVRVHQRLAAPRPGFYGAAADMWAAGVIVTISRAFTPNCFIKGSR